MTTAPSPPVATAENVTGSRILSGFIDIILAAVVFVVMSIIFGESKSDTGNGASFEANLSGLPFIAFVLIVLAYHVVLEKTTGQTLGKKIAGIKVVAADGSLTWGKVVTRNLLRLVDALPAF